MDSTIVTVVFEYTDAHMSIVDDGSLIDDIEKRCIKLCEIFDFEYKRQYKRLDDTPHWTFCISFNKTILTFQHYINVLTAFAQEFQINIANAYDELA
jgi:hypothetical protein